MAAKKSRKNGKVNGGGSQFEQTFKNIDDVLWKEAGCSSELDYTEQTSWLLFLKYLDDLEQEKAMEAELRGKSYEYIIDEPYRWSSCFPIYADSRNVHLAQTPSRTRSVKSSAR
jgi:hypothetical protein